MDIVFGLAFNLLLPLAIVYVMHRWIGWYPDQWKTSVNPKREIAEIGVFWLLAMIASTAFLLTRSQEELSVPTTAVALEHMAYAVVPWLILPLGYMALVRKWRWHDFGFTLPKSWPMIVFGLALFGLAGMLPVFNSSFEPMSWAFVAIAAYQPAFIEEFFFRVIIQGKFERVVGPTKAWIYTGILFGLAHVPVDFFGPQFYANGESYLNAFVVLLTQIIGGWIFGLIYAKTRSIFPGMLAHFMMDGRLGSIFIHLFG